MAQHIITALVGNRSGVLSKVTGMFSRRGFNIESLSVCSTSDPKLSRMTLAVGGGEAVLDQIIKQLGKLIDAVKVAELSPESSVTRELLLVKILVPAARRPEIESTCNIYKAKTVDLSPESVIIELTGEGGKIDAFLELLKPYEILEMARTGPTALTRGKGTILDAENAGEK